MINLGTVEVKEGLQQQKPKLETLFCILKRNIFMEFFSFQFLLLSKIIFPFLT